MKKFFKLENIIYLVVAGLPLYLVKLDFFGLPTNVLEFLQMIVICWWFFDKNYEKPKVLEIWEKYGKYLVTIGLIFFGLFSSMLINGNYRGALGIIKSWFLVPMLFSFIVINFFNREKIKNIWLSFYFSAVVVSLAAIIYYFFGRLTYDGRLEAFFNSPNYLAMVLSPALIIGLISAQKKNEKIRIKSYALKVKHLYSAMCVIIAIGLYLTYSYAAWIAAALSLVIAETIAQKKNILKSRIFWVGIVLVGLVFSAQWGSGKLRAIYAVSERSSIASRLMIWKTAGKLAHDNPVWGIGPGNFQNKYLEYQKFFPPYLEWAVSHPHNIFLAFFLYSGLAGTIGFVMLVFFWFRDVLKKEDSALKTIFLGVMIYALLHGLVDTTYFKNDLAVIFWLSFLALNLKKAS